MMEAIRYITGELVKVGDKVIVKRFLRRQQEGIVEFVYDPEKPSPVKGDNDYGVSIKLSNGHSLWGFPGRETFFVSREEQ